MPKEEDIAVAALYHIYRHGPMTLKRLSQCLTEHFKARVTPGKIAFIISLYQLPLKYVRYKGRSLLTAPKELYSVDTDMNTEVKRMSISLEEFEQLLEYTEFGRGKVPTEAILEYLSDKAATTAEIANHFGIKTVSMLNRLKRLHKNGLVRVKTDGKKYYWTSAGTTPE